MMGFDEWSLRFGLGLFAVGFYYFFIKWSERDESLKRAKQELADYKTKREY